MEQVGRLMLFVGLAVAVIGAVVWLAGRAGFRGLPGDVRYEGESVRFYFPIVTCIALSAALTLGMWLWRWLTGPR
jgi:hypothetical protein